MSQRDHLEIATQRRNEDETGIEHDTPEDGPRGRGARLASFLLLAILLGTGGVLAAWKIDSIKDQGAAAAAQPEPMEVVTATAAAPRQHRRTTTSIGTVLATRSITLRNELPGTVSEVRLTPGQVVEAGAVLVRLDVAVESAELRAQEAQASLAESVLARNQQASRTHAVSATEVDRAKAERDVALAQIARTRAIIERKTLRAPFRARVGLADVHRGQYLDEGTVLTTLQGIAEAAHVDFAVAQRVAAGLKVGDQVAVHTTGVGRPLSGTIVAIDARVDATTRNAMVRAKIADAGDGPPPGASVRVEVSDGPPAAAVAVPVAALRKGPAGDHVFVIARDDAGKPRAHVRAVQSGAMLADQVLIHQGLEAGELVASSGSFKLREGVLVVLAEQQAAAAAPEGR